MATGTDAIIFAALTEKLQSLTLTPPLQIAYPNILFPKAGQPKPEKYLRLDFLPNVTRQITIGDDAQQKRGIAQVTVMWPKGSGVVDALAVADRIIDLFKNLTLFASGVRITISREPWASSPIQEDAGLSIPVTIPYHAFEPEA